MAAPPPSSLDGNQVLQHSFEDSTGRIRVDANVSVDIGDLEIEIDHTNDSIRLGDGTNFLTSTTIGPSIGLDVNVINSDLDIRDITHTSDSIQIGDGTTLTQVSGQGELLVVDGVNTPNNDIVNLITSNTEYSYMFPQPTKKFVLKSRTKTTLKLSYTMGEVVGGTNYITIPSGATYEMDNINLASALIIYMSASNNNRVVEIESWG